MRYRIELILSFPFIALVMAMYLLLALKPHSAVQHPERLYKERNLMAAVVVCSVVIGLLLIVRLPALARIFTPTAPTSPPPSPFHVGP